MILPLEFILIINTQCNQANVLTFVRETTIRVFFFSCSSVQEQSQLTSCLNACNRMNKQNEEAAIFFSSNILQLSIIIIYL